MVGPLDPAVYPHAQRNRFGVILKPHQQGKWRLIVNLSHPEESSVNEAYHLSCVPYGMSQWTMLLN